MMQRDISKSQSGVGQGKLAPPVKALAVVGTAFGAVAWMAVGLVGFFMIHAWGVAYDRKMAMIERSGIKPDIPKRSDNRWSLRTA